MFGWSWYYLVYIHGFSLMKIHVSVLLNTSSIAVLTPLNTSGHMSLLSNFFWFSWYLSILARYIKPNFLTFYLLNTSSKHQRFLRSTPPRYLLIHQVLILDICSIYQDAWFYIYLKINLVSFLLKHLDSTSTSLDSLHLFSLKSIFQSHFWPIPSFNSLVSGLNLIFSSSHAFRPRFLNFFENFRVFVFEIKLWV